MTYEEGYAQQVARLWDVSPATLARWKRNGLIPDKYISRQPINDAGQQVENKLLATVGTGWIKARPISRMIGHPDKINALIASKRHPDDKRYHVNNLDGDEVSAIEKLLSEMQRTLGGLLYMASVTPESQEYGEVVQNDLRTFLRREEVDTANLRAGLDKTEAGRLWSFVTRGRDGQRQQLDMVFARLKSLLELLS